MSTLFVLKNVPVFFYFKQRRISILENQNTVRVYFTLLEEGGGGRRAGVGGKDVFEALFHRLWKKSAGTFFHIFSAWQISADSEQLGKSLRNSHKGAAFMEPLNYSRPRPSSLWQVNYFQAEVGGGPSLDRKEGWGERLVHGKLVIMFGTVRFFALPLVVPINIDPIFIYCGNCGMFVYILVCFYTCSSCPQGEGRVHGCRYRNQVCFPGLGGGFLSIVLVICQ